MSLAEEVRYMKRETTFLRGTLVLTGIPVLAVLVILLPLILKDASLGSREMARVLYGITGVLCVSAIPFFMGYYQGFRLLGMIDRGEAFSEASVRILRTIRRLALAVSLVHVAGLPLYFIVGEVDDAPGVILMGLVLIFAPLVVAVFAAVLTKLLESAVEMKEEQDLTV